MPFVHFKMAVARFTILISFLLYKQGIRGQQSSLMNGPSIGQNGLNQVFSSNTGTENLVKNQNGNSENVATNINSHSPVHFQPLTPQSTISTQSTLSLQQPQSVSQPLNFQLSQPPNFQHAITIQPSLQFDSSLLQQPAGLQKPQSLPQKQNVYKIPLNIQPYKQLNSQQSPNLGDFNIQKQLPIASPAVQQIPARFSPGISIPNAPYVSSFPSVSAMPNYPYQHTNNKNNVATNYLPSTAGIYSVVETPQISTTYSRSPVMAVLSTPSSIPVVTHPAMPYGNQAPDIVESPLRISNNFFTDDQVRNPNQHSFTSALLSLLQSPKTSFNSEVTSGYQGNPYLQAYLNQGSKSSSIKTLLPLILDLISEKREDCGCDEGCRNCERKRKTKNEPKIYSGYSKKKDYSLRDEMFRKESSEEEMNPRMVREHKQLKKLKNFVPVDSCEDEDAYSDCSEEEEN